MYKSSFDEERHRYSIAVIGMAGVFADAPSLDHLWRNLLSGHEVVRHLDDATLLANGCPEWIRSHPLFMPMSAFMRDVSRFDAEFFGFTPAEATLMDPQLRLMLQVAWHAFEDAHHVPGSGGLTGVFAGAHKSDYLLCNAGPEYSVMTGMKAMSASLFNGQDFLATWLSYKLGLTGPSLNVQTACSTGLVTVATACQNLLDYSCDVALAVTGAVFNPRDWGYLAETGSILSGDGHCRPFDAEATGTVTGEGVGAVVLKRLSDALRDKDSVHGIIRGFAVNNDGGARAGYTTPSVAGQVVLLEQALASSGLCGSDVSYVEAHGTGTPLGDPVEFRALQEAYGRVPRKGPCLLGSVKANLGHLGACAGMVGLLKVLLMLRHGEIPPQVNFSRPNPEVHLEGSAFAISTTSKAWSAERPRVAGVSSFGLGGTNCHMLVEGAEALPRPEDTSITPAVLPLCLAAKSRDALDRLRQGWSSLLAARPEVDLPQVTRCALTGRSAMPWRLAVAGTHPEALVERLENASEAAFIAPGTAATTVLFLPDLVAEAPELSQALIASLPPLAGAFARCARYVAEDTGGSIDIMPGCSPVPKGDAEARWRRTCAVALCIGLGYLCHAVGFRPHMVIGCGCGALAARALAGGCSEAEAMRLVASDMVQSGVASGYEGGASSGLWDGDVRVVDLTGETLSSDTLRQGIARCHDLGANVFVAACPSHADGLLRDTLLPDGDMALVSLFGGLSAGTTRAADHSEQMLAQGLARLFMAGVDLAPVRTAPPVDIPIYPFAQDVYWLNTGTGAADALGQAAGQWCGLYSGGVAADMASSAAASSDVQGGEASAEGDAHAAADIEHVLCGIWNAALGISDIGPDDDFFMRGGTSLSAITIIAETERCVGLSVPLRDFLELRTINRVMERLARLAAEADAA